MVKGVPKRVLLSTQTATSTRARRRALAQFQCNGGRGKAEEGRVHLRLPLDDTRAHSDMGSRYSYSGSDGDAGCLADCKTSRARGPGAA